MRKLNLSCGCVCERQAAAAQRGAQQQGKKKGKKKGKKPKKDGLDMEEILAVQVTPLPVLCSWPDNRHDGDLTVESAHLCWCVWLVVRRRR